MGIVGDGRWMDGCVSDCLLVHVLLIISSVSAMGLWAFATGHAENKC